MTTQTSSTSRTVSAIALIYALRMLGLFMILPVFSLYAHQLQSATPLLIGVTLGIYGASQAALQIPFGMLSDKYGRKPLITIGLCLFALGSVVAACSGSIYGVMLGRLLQGAGAIGSTLIALLADLTDDSQRSKAMASIGMTIGLSFSVAMLLGPILSVHIHVSGIFWLTALLAISAIFILYYLVPTPSKLLFHNDSGTMPKLFKSVLRNRELLRLDLAIFMQHAILTASFVVIPLILQQLNIATTRQWQVYLPVLVLSFLISIPFIIIAEKKCVLKPAMLGAILTIGCSQLLLWGFHSSQTQVTLALLLYFSAFNLLEATLPSLISKVAPLSCKGTAMGVYSSAQFFGIFVGGTLGGWLLGQHAPQAVFYACAMLALIWLFVASTMQKPHHVRTQVVHLGGMDAKQAERLQQQILTLAGVAEVAVAVNEGTAYLKIDARVFDQSNFENRRKAWLEELTK